MTRDKKERLENKLNSLVKAHTTELNKEAMSASGKKLTNHSDDSDNHTIFIKEQTRPIYDFLARVLKANKSA